MRDKRLAIRDIQGLGPRPGQWPEHVGRLVRSNRSPHLLPGHWQLPPGQREELEAGLVHQRTKPFDDPPVRVGAGKGVEMLTAIPHREGPEGLLGQLGVEGRNRPGPGSWQAGGGWRGSLEETRELTGICATAAGRPSPDTRRSGRSGVGSPRGVRASDLHFCCAPLLVQARGVPGHVACPVTRNRCEKPRLKSAGLCYVPKGRVGRG